MASFDPNNDYLFQDDLFDDLLNDLVYDDLGGDLVSFPAAEITVEENTEPLNIPISYNNNSYVNTQPQNVEAAIPVSSSINEPLSSSFSHAASIISAPNNNTMYAVQSTQSGVFMSNNSNPKPVTNNTTTASKHPSNSIANQSTSAKKNKKEKEPASSSSSSSSAAASAASVAAVNATIQRIRTLTLLPILIFKAFNGGDLPKVREIIREVTIKDCALKTPALDAPVYGQNNVIDLFQAIYDSHPDAVWVAKQCKLNEETNVIQCRVYFAGTRIAPIYKSSAAENLHDSNHADYLYKKRNSSLLDEMDVNLLSPMEVESMRELEKLSRNLSVFFKGTLDLEVDDTSAGGDKIRKFDFDWTITSFREADI